jgi:hypothetical protein
VGWDKAKEVRLGRRQRFLTELYGLSCDRRVASISLMRVAKQFHPQKIGWELI